MFPPVDPLQGGIFVQVDPSPGSPVSDQLFLLRPITDDQFPRAFPVSGAVRPARGTEVEPASSYRPSSDDARVRLWAHALALVRASGRDHRSLSRLPSHDGPALVVGVTTPIGACYTPCSDGVLVFVRYNAVLRTSQIRL